MAKRCKPKTPQKIKQNTTLRYDLKVNISHNAIKPKHSLVLTKYIRILLLALTQKFLLSVLYGRSLCDYSNR